MTYPRCLGIWSEVRSAISYPCSLRPCFNITSSFRQPRVRHRRRKRTRMEIHTRQDRRVRSSTRGSTSEGHTYTYRRERRRRGTLGHCSRNVATGCDAFECPLIRVWFFIALVLLMYLVCSPNFNAQYVLIGPLDLKGTRSRFSVSQPVKRILKYASLTLIRIQVVISHV